MVRNNGCWMSYQWRQSGQGVGAQGRVGQGDRGQGRDDRRGRDRGILKDIIETGEGEGGKQSNGR